MELQTKVVAPLFYKAVLDELQPLVASDPRFAQAAAIAKDHYSRASRSVVGLANIISILKVIAASSPRNEYRPEIEPDQSGQSVSMVEPEAITE